MSERSYKIKNRASDLLSSLLGISQERINLELEGLGENEAKWRAQEREFLRGTRQRPQDEAESYHRRLLLGNKMNQFSKLPSDLILFAVTVTAHQIGELACCVSSGKGGLKELALRFESFEQAENLDYHSSEILQSDQMLEKIHDSVFLSILDRYDLKKYGLLYEENRPLYEIRFEVGRRLVTPDSFDPSGHKDSVTKFRNLYGPKLVQEFLRRLKRHSLIPN